MVNYVVLSGALALFMMGIRLSKVVGLVLDLSRLSRDTVAVMRDPALSDIEKEKATQKAAVTSFKSFIAITLRVAAIVGAPAALVYLGARTGAYSLGGIEAAAFDWWFVVASTVVMVALFRFVK